VTPDETEGTSAFLILFAGLLGAVIGSFLNVCILRWGAEPKQSVMHPRSRCPKCGQSLHWYENVPIVSWLVQHGRCRACGEPISLQYPLIELATAFIWAFMVWRHGFGLHALGGAIFVTILLGIAITDLRAYIIPDEFSLGGLGLGVVFALLNGFHPLVTSLLGAAVGFGMLWLIAILGEWMFKQEAMGGGDIKMMAMVGAFLGWQGTLLTVFLGALIGSLIFVPLSMVGHKRLVPFGIFLAIGAVATYLIGPGILAWYGNYLRSA
jgi:leader peptidase (prepilin peptidase)/N-methyltransferase